MRKTLKAIPPSSVNLTQNNLQKLSMINRGTPQGSAHKTLTHNSPEIHDLLLSWELKLNQEDLDLNHDNSNDIIPNEFDSIPEVTKSPDSLEILRADEQEMFQLNHAANENHYDPAQFDKGQLEISSTTPHTTTLKDVTLNISLFPIAIAISPIVLGYHTISSIASIIWKCASLPAVLISQEDEKNNND